MRKVVVACGVILGLSLGWKAASGQSNSPIQHVLLISIDGAHALDVEKYVAAKPDSALAAISGMSVKYTNASLPIGDFFPGLLALTTGGTPNSTGVWYDEGWDRSLSPAGSDCKTTGTEFVFDEKADIDVTQIDGGGGLNPAKFPLDPKNGCKQVYPHALVRVNSIFDVAKANWMRTAWADKHWVCDLVTGKDGKSVDDFYIREVGTGAIANDLTRTAKVDDLRVQGIINEIDGFDHDRKDHVGVPGIFGITLQSLAVAQKQPGDGYLDAAGTPSAAVQKALDHTDEAVGKMIGELKAQNLLSSTLVVITAVHGDSPIDPKLSHKISDDLLTKMIGEDKVLDAVEDTEAFIWLKDQSQTAKVAALLMQPENRRLAAINEIVFGDALKLVFNDPMVDGRAPDIIVKPLVGVYYAGNESKKIAEHGGFYSQDVNVPLLLANPSFTAAVIKTPVAVMSVAPTVLKELGLNPQDLQAVQMEKTPLLPGLD